MPALLRLRVTQYKKLAKLKGWTTDEAAAAAIGVHPTTVSRIVRGRNAPSAPFIAGLLLAGDPFDFYDLFEAENDDDHEDHKDAAA